MYNLALFPCAVYSTVSCSLIFCANDFLTVLAGFWSISLGFTALWSSTIFSGFLSSLTSILFLLSQQGHDYMLPVLLHYHLLSEVYVSVLRTCLSTKLFSTCTPINIVLSQKSCFYEFLLDFHSHLSDNNMDCMCAVTCPCVLASPVTLASL